MGYSWAATEFACGEAVRGDPAGLGGRGDPDALYALGISYSTGTDGVSVNLVEAHKWFNLAATAGLPAAADARADVADGMTPREIAEAQRQARAWLGAARAGLGAVGMRAA